MRTLNPTAAAARAMDRGDMLATTLQYWKGRSSLPMPGDSEPTLRYKAERRTAFLRDLSAGFVPAENMIKGVTENAADHVVGSEPTWNLTGEQTAECEKIITAAWNKRDLLSVVQDALRPRIREGDGAVRVRIPPGAIKLALTPGAQPLKAASDWLRYEALTEPERLTITEDEETLTLRATYDLGSDADGNPRGVEYARVDSLDGFTVLELEKDGTRSLLWRLPLGGLLPYVQVQGPALITQGMIDNQSGANLIMTAALSNSELAGQIMEHFHNMQPQRGPDKVVMGADGEPLIGTDGQPVTLPGEPLPALRGPGGELYTADTVAIQTVEDDKGERQIPVILNGSYQRHGPVSSEALDFTLSRCERNIYAEAKQRHYLMADKASATGEARKTAMSSFFKSLNGFRTDAVKLLRGLLQVTLAMSHALCKQPIPQVEVEPVLTDRLVDPTPEERAADRDDVAAGIISKEAARARQGLPNSAAMQKQIDAEKAAEPPAPVPAPTPTPPAPAPAPAPAA